MASSGNLAFSEKQNVKPIWKLFPVLSILGVGVPVGRRKRKIFKFNHSFFSFLSNYFTFKINLSNFCFYRKLKETLEEHYCKVPLLHFYKKGAYKNKKRSLTVGGLLLSIRLLLRAPVVVELNIAVNGKIENNEW